MNNAKILIVDDSASDIRLVMECLKENYTLSAATTGEKAIELAFANQPDIILMDISMPIMNGYETCKAILKKQHAKIIFLSANNSTEEIIRGYDAGGIDYIIKPFNPSELQQKIELTLSSNIAAPITEASTQNNIDALRLIVDFNRHSLALTGVQQLADLMISQLNNLQLSASVQLHAQSGIFEASSVGDLSKLESEILTRFLQEDGRVFQQPNRLLVTYDNIGLLIKNLPEDANKQNPLTHTLSHYVENANAVLLNIDTSLSPKPALNNALAGNECLQLLAQLNTHAQSQQAYKKASVQIIDELIATLEAACVDLALTYNQEQALMNILHNGIDKSLKQYEVGTQLDEQFELSLKSLGRALGQ